MSHADNDPSRRCTSGARYVLLVNEKQRVLPLEMLRAASAGNILSRCGNWMQRHLERNGSESLQSR
jgi:hypothetical protein